jgi:hypothetical protein
MFTVTMGQGAASFGEARQAFGRVSLVATVRKSRRTHDMVAGL